jgi:small-conductance mechanosensitive channel
MSTSELLRTIVLGQRLSAWLLAAAIAAIVAVAMLIVRSVLARRLERIALRTTTTLDDAVVEVLRRTRLYFILIVALAAGSRALDLPAGARDAIRIAMLIVFFVQLAVWTNAIITAVLKGFAAKSAGANGASATAVAAFGVLIRAAVWFIIGLIALHGFGVEVTALVTGLGISGVAIALAVQNILGDLFAAFSIVLDKPFVVGDTIAVDTFNGTVEHVGLKTTRVRSVNGEQLVFSNADLLKSRIRNFKRMHERRVLFSLSIEYDTPIATVERIPSMVRDIIAAQPNVRFDRAHFRGFGESSLDFETAYFVISPDYRVYMDTQQRINIGILRRFTEEGIAFAYPTRAIITRKQWGQTPIDKGHS